MMTQGILKNRWDTVRYKANKKERLSQKSFCHRGFFCDLDSVVWKGIPHKAGMTYWLISTFETAFV